MRKVELRIEGITNIEEANDYLVNKFIPNFNNRFALNYKKYPSVFEFGPMDFPRIVK